MNESQARENVRRCLKRNSRPGQRVVIVTDPAADERVVSLLVGVSRELELSAMVQQAVVSAPNAEPSEQVAQGLLGRDLVILATTQPISHTAAVWNAVQSGASIIVMDGVTLDTLEGGAASADYEQMHDLGLVLERRWNEARSVRVTSDLGTDLRANIDGRVSWRWDGTVFSAPQFSIKGCAFPDGEVGIAPVEGSANGTVVWDGSVHSLGLLSSAVRLSVQDGWITSIDGGSQARDLAHRLSALEDPNSYYCPAEIAIGINEGARITGLLREDKKARGTVHIACGTNIDLGGTIAASVHIDGVILTPSLWMDDDLVLDHGRIVGLG